MDESGFYLLPSVARTYAPVGETPILRHRLSRDHLSVIGAVGLHERLYFQVHEQAITSREVIGFLNHLLRHIPGKLLIVWDGAPIHRSKAIRQYLSEGAAARIHLERFPGYAPELDPQEGVWRHLKRVEMRNLCCSDLQETRRELRAACQRLRQRPHIIRSCLRHSGLV
ncbi:MAG: transposase [Chloroflexota bacterium]|nr:transposase [Chloroflexota bacterium]